MATISYRADDINNETLPDDNPTTLVTVDDPRGPVSFEIDLSDTSFKALVKALEKYASKGRAVTPPTSRKLGDDATEAAEARAWAMTQRPDLNVKERGAVPKAAIAAYRAHLEMVEDMRTIENALPLEQ